MSRVFVLITIAIIITLGCLNTTQDVRSPINTPQPKRFEVIDTNIPLTYYGVVDDVYLGYQPASHNIALKAREAFYDYRKTGNTTSLERGLYLADFLIENASYKKDNTIMLWEYPFPWPSYNLSEGWIGSLSQAGILKVFLLAYQSTSDEKYLVSAKKNLNAFSTDFGDGGLRLARIDNGGVYYWYPEYASNDPPYVLNGFITALLWIKEFYDVTGYAQAKKVYENGLEGLIHYLPSYDDSGWSYYDGIGHTSSEHYHKMHVTQLQSLYNVTGYPIFLHYNERWKEGKIDKPTNSSQVWIEIHDVGANYDLDELKKVITTLEKYPGAYDRIVLFVIPNYGDENPFHESPEFSDYIKTLESSGYLLGQHGYTHDGREFAVDREDAEDIVKLGIGEFFLSGFKDPKIFLAPRWNYTEESIGVAQRYFDEVYMDNGIYFEDTFTRYLVHEYTNSSIRMDYKAQLEQAKKDYGESKGIFRLSMHLKFASSQDHLDFLDEFLPWIESGKN